MPDGRIEPRQVQRLKEMGDWLKKYGDAVYGTRGGPFMPGEWGASTCKKNKIYLFVMNWPKGRPLKIPAAQMKIKKASAKSGGTVKMSRKEGMIELDVSQENRDPIATVIELTVDGKAFEIKPVKVVSKSNSVASGKQAKASSQFGKSDSNNDAKARQAELVSALTALKNHITGAVPLSASEIAAHKLTIDANKNLFDSSSAIITASFDLVETYDDVIGPLWVSGSPVQSFSRSCVSF